MVHKYIIFLKQSLNKIEQNKHAIAFENIQRYITSSDTMGITFEMRQIH